MEQIVKIKNAADDDFVSEYEFQMYTIPAGTDGLFPWGVVCCWLGDPNTRDSDREQARREEYNRMKIRYGAYDDPSQWDLMKPNLEVYTTSGDRIWTVVDDPTGERDITITGGDTKSAYDRVEQLTRELDALRASLASSGSTASTPDTLDLPKPEPVSSKPPADTPNKRGRPRKQPIEPPNVDVPKDAPNRVPLT